MDAIVAEVDREITADEVEQAKKAAALVAAQYAAVSLALNMVAYSDDE